MTRREILSRWLAAAMRERRDRRIALRPRLVYYDRVTVWLDGVKLAEDCEAKIEVR